jgi:hypothetical protein
VLVNYLLKIMETGKDVMKCTLLDAIRTTAVLWEIGQPETIAVCRFSFQPHFCRRGSPTSGTATSWSSVTKKLEVEYPFAEYIIADKTVKV